MEKTGLAISARPAWSHPHGQLARFLLIAALLLACGSALAASSNVPAAFPPPLDSYNDAHVTAVWDVLVGRARRQPFNVWATALFLAAVCHTFFTHKFRHWAHVLEDRHLKQQHHGSTDPLKTAPISATVESRILHFLGEVEVVFGLWAMPLFLLMVLQLGNATATHYVNDEVGQHEALFVVVIMTMAATRPVLRLAENCLRLVAAIGRGTPTAWWLAILTIGPLFGSFITEPAAMTISASLLAKYFFGSRPSTRLAYATLGLLFVNVSVGGVLTHFAAPPVLMVAAPWNWGTGFMLKHFGWVAVVGILACAGLYLVTCRKWLAGMTSSGSAATDLPLSSTPAAVEPKIPAWVTIVHLLAMFWAVVHAHHPALLLGGFLFFLAFCEVTQEYQSELQLRPAILVGFFLAGLVIHGNLQQWWIQPVLGRLGALPLMLGSVCLTAVNDNAAVTYLATLVPALTAGMKYAVVAGAICGGGLTVIANAPNPAGQAILGKHFKDGISPLGLLLGALPATFVMVALFLLVGAFFDW